MLYMAPCRLVYAIMFFHAVLMAIYAICERRHYARH